MRTRAAAGMTIAGVLLLGCTRGPTPAPAEVSAHSKAGDAVSEVRWFGALRGIMHEGRTEAAVGLADVVPGPHAWGLGALEGLRGEVTILDDVVWLARPTPDATAILSHGAMGEIDKAQGAALLVVANVAAWDELPVPTNVGWGSLDSFLESTLRARGDALDRPVPLRVEGPVASLRWHVVDGSKMEPGAGHAEHARTAVSGRAEYVDAKIIGFFSRAHEGVFTHRGVTVHAP